MPTVIPLFSACCKDSVVSIGLLGAGASSWPIKKPGFSNNTFVKIRHPQGCGYCIQRLPPQPVRILALALRARVCVATPLRVWALQKIGEGII
jgi:hypothetical protein